MLLHTYEMQRHEHKIGTAYSVLVVLRYSVRSSWSNAGAGQRHMMHIAGEGDMAG